jgi:serine/threonine protein kinase
MATLEAILTENGLGKWHATLTAEEIDLDNISDMTMDDLKELGLPLGARKNILKLFGAKPQQQVAELERQLREARVANGAAPALVLAPGTFLQDGKYKLGEMIGEGGCSTVRRATDTMLGRDVAIKCCHPQVNETYERHSQRVRRECEIVASLRTPNAMKVFDVFEESRCWFIVCELIDGVTLRAHGVPVASPGEAVSIVQQVLRALDALHSAGYVHRDVKPENVMVINSSGGTESLLVKLIDFGIAKEHDASENGSGAPANITTVGIVFGTPRYMGKLAVGLSTNSRLDLWSTAVLLYELLVGDVPFQPGTLDHAQLAMRPLHASGASAALMAVVGRALKTNPDLGYQSAHEFEAALADVTSRDTARFVADAGATPWAALARIPNLNFAAASGSAVQLCSLDYPLGGPASPGALAVWDQLKQWIVAAPQTGGQQLLEEFEPRRVVVVKSTPRSLQHMNTLQDMHRKLRGARGDASHVFNHTDGSKGWKQARDGPAAKVRKWNKLVMWRSKTLERALETCHHFETRGGVGVVRVVLVFHVPKSEQAGREILEGNFHDLARRDRGFFGNGIYFSPHARHLMFDYWKEGGGRDMDSVPLIVAAVAIGNEFPVVEGPDDTKNGWLGKPLQTGAFAHVAVVA